MSIQDRDWYREDLAERLRRIPATSSYGTMAQQQQQQPPARPADLVRAYRVGRLYARILRRVERPGAYERIALTAVLTGVGGTDRSNAAACA